MKDVHILKVETIDFDTYETIPNAEIFANEFREFLASPIEYQFMDFQSLDRAKKRLNELNLEFDEYFERKLETDLELENYPAVFLIVPTEDNLFKNGILNQNKIKNLMILKDVISDELFIHKDLHSFMLMHSISMMIDEIGSGNHNFVKLKKLPELKNSEEYIGASGVKEVSQQKFALIKSDDRILVSNDAIKEISNETLLLTNHFLFKGIKYASTSSSLITNGNFAKKLNAFLVSKQNAPLNIFIPIVE